MGVDACDVQVTHFGAPQSIMSSSKNWAAQWLQSRPAALKILGSNPGRGAKEFSKLTFITRYSATSQLHVTQSSVVPCAQYIMLKQLKILDIPK